MIYFYTNEEHAAKGVFYKIEPDCIGVDLSDDEVILKRFIPHPEEHRLGALISTQFESSSYYSDYLNSMDELNEVQDSWISKYWKKWNAILEENKDYKDLNSLGADYYVNSCWALVELSFNIFEYIENVEKDKDLFDQDYDDLYTLFADDLIGYTFNRFYAEKWFDSETDSYCITKGLKVIKDFLYNSIKNICLSSDEWVVVGHLDDLFEFISYNAEYTRNGNPLILGEDITGTLCDLTNNLWQDNPYIHFISLYEHSGICLQWGGGSCRWDSTAGAAIIIGDDNSSQGTFNYVDNVLQGNVWVVTQYKVVENINLYDYYENIDIDDRDTCKLLNLADGDDIIVTELDSCGGFVCDYNDWKDVTTDYFSIDRLPEGRDYEIEKSILHKWVVNKPLKNSHVSLDNLPDDLVVTNCGGFVVLVSANENTIANFVKEYFDE